MGGHQVGGGHGGIHLDAEQIEAVGRSDSEMGKDRGVSCGSEGILDECRAAAQRGRKRTEPGAVQGECVAVAGFDSASRWQPVSVGDSLG